MRMLDTIEDMDSLPVGSIVLEGETGEPIPWLNIHVMPGVFHRFPDGWYVAGHGARDLQEGTFPVGVLWTPEISGEEK